MAAFETISGGDEEVKNFPPASSGPTINNGALVPSNSPVIPVYTPSEVNSAAKKSTPKNVSPFSASSLASGAVSTQSAITAASNSLTQLPAGTPQPFTYNGQNYDFSNLPNGMSLTPQAGQPNWIQTSVMGPNGSPLWVNTQTFPGASAGGAGGQLPPNYSVGGTDAQGNVTYNNTVNGSSFTLSPNATVTPAQTATNLQNVQQSLQSSLGAGYNVAVQPNGDFAITDANGNAIGTIPASAASDPTTALPSYVTALGAKSTAITAANTTLQSSLAALKAQNDLTIQQLQEEMDSATGEALAASGGGLGTNASMVSDAKTRIQSLIDEENANYASEQLAAQGTNQQAIASAESSFASATASILTTAQGVVSSNLSAAQTSAQNTNLLGVSLPGGQTWQTVQNNPSSVLNAQGQTGVPEVDSLIQQFVKGGYTPSAALQAISTIQLANQKTATTNAQALMAGILPNVVAGMTDDQIVSQYGTVVSAWENAGLTQAQAIAQIRAGTAAEQKTNLTAFGSPTGGPTTPTIVSAAPPDPSIGDTTGAGIATGTRYTPNAIYQDAIEYAMTGKVPSLGLGTAAQVQQARAAINNVAASIVAAAGQNFPALQALYKANSSAATQSIQRLARIQIVENSAISNFPRLETLADSVKAAGINITESDIQAGSASVLARTGNSDAAAYVELINTIRSDYSAMQAALAGSRGGQYFTETAAQAIPAGYTSAQYTAIANTITLNAQSASTATQGEVSDLLSISGGSGSVGTGSTGNSGGTNTYTIASGDTFSSIAAANGLTADQIASANPGVDPNNLQPGQSIVLPGAPASGNGTMQPAGTIVTYNGQQYVVGADGNTLTPYTGQ